ncbi:MAG: amidohydrolase family protein [Acidimicrobiia bacterium]|nr:amidohydrolase family protein [Acidimicrobiia bacterium]
MLDTKITGGLVCDGTNTTPRRVDVGVRDGRVVAVGTVDEPAAVTIDARGKIVAPGFVDLHTHYDAQVFWDPDLTPSPLHGVTTALGGNCGFSIAPLSAEAGGYLMRMLARVEGIPVSVLEEGVPWDWSTTAEYLDRLDGSLAVNTGWLVGHSALRRVAMGPRGVGGEAEPADLDEMRRLLDAGLGAGALGFSSSWAATHNDSEGNAVPSRASTPEELVALCEVVGRHDGTTLEFIPAVEVWTDDHVDIMARMSVAANRPLNWNLLAVSQWDTDVAMQKLAASDHAAHLGGTVKALTVPDALGVRLTFKTGFVLDSFPGWAKPMALPDDEKIAMLADPAERRRLDTLAKQMEGRLRALAEWTPFTIAETFSPETRKYEGRMVWEIAEEEGRDPFDVLCDIVVADNLLTGLATPRLGEDDGSWAARVEIWRDPRAVVGASDAGAHLDMITTFNYTTTLLHEAVAKRGLLPVEEAVHYLSDVPARLYGLTDRGRIRQGWYADLVVFDLDTVGPGDVYTRFDLPAGEGRLYSGGAGIEHVLVNGTEIVRNGEMTGAKPGTLLRSGRDTETVEAAG